jgi:transposase
MKVIKALDSGMKKTEVSKIFNISRNTINLWLMRRKESGDYRAKNGYQQGYNPKINDLEEFQEFVEKHSSQTQKEMAESWEKRSVIKPLAKP